MTLAAAAHRLCDLLERENAALTAMDLAAAADCIGEKQTAIACLFDAHRHDDGRADAAKREAAERLNKLARTNRILLERAMLAQDRILGCIARALPRSGGGRYGAAGANVGAPVAPPVALSARA